MTTEDDFQRALDRRRSDWQTRLVFADWLDERGDPRGPGYRALARLGRGPRRGTLDRSVWQWWDKVAAGAETDWKSDLPPDWFKIVHHLTDLEDRRGDYASLFASRAKAEDAAALAFAQLPLDRQAELLNPTVKRVRRKRARK